MQHLFGMLKVDQPNEEEYIDKLEIERDVYFGKLRDIEVICQDSIVSSGKELEHLNKILEVSYAIEVNTFSCFHFLHVLNHCFVLHCRICGRKACVLGYYSARVCEFESRQYLEYKNSLGPTLSSITMRY